MKIVKDIVHYFAVACYVLITIYGIVCIPSIFGYRPLIVLTGSMEPTYKVGSIIYYKKVSKEELKIGDAITFKLSDGSYVSHRINSIKGDKYVTKGDANNSVDANPVSYVNIVGRDSKFSIPILGYFIKIVNDNLYFIVFIIAILIAEFILGSVNEKKGSDIIVIQE